MLAYSACTGAGGCLHAACSLTGIASTSTTPATHTHTHTHTHRGASKAATSSLATAQHLQAHQKELQAHVTSAADNALSPCCLMCCCSCCCCARDRSVLPANRCMYTCAAARKPAINTSGLCSPHTRICHRQARRLHVSTCRRCFDGSTCRRCLSYSNPRSHQACALAPCLARPHTQIAALPPSVRPSVRLPACLPARNQ